MNNQVYLIQKKELNLPLGIWEKTPVVIVPDYDTAETKVEQLCREQLEHAKYPIGDDFWESYAEYLDANPGATEYDHIMVYMEV